MSWTWVLVLTCQGDYCDWIQVLNSWGDDLDSMYLYWPLGEMTWAMCTCTDLQVRCLRLLVLGEITGSLGTGTDH